MRRRGKGTYIRSTLISLKPKKCKAVTALYTFVGGPWHGQRAKLSASLQETDVVSCGKCGCKGRYKVGMTQAQEKAMKNMKPITIQGLALCWQ